MRCVVRILIMSSHKLADELGEEDGDIAQSPQ